MKRDLNFYINAFTHLKRAANKGGAPHKPVLLLALIKGFSTGLLHSNKIYISAEFVGLFKSIWKKLIVSDFYHTPRFFMPCYHLKNEKAEFWRLIPKNGYEIWLASRTNVSSLNQLKSAVDYIDIDLELSELLLIEKNRKLLQSAIIETYFPAGSNLDEGGSDDYLNNLSHEILNDSTEIYIAKMDALRANLKEIDFEEEVYVRSGRFKREVLNAYNNTCAISGLNIYVRSEQTVSMLDTCHIIPFSETHDDTISNGIALTPTLHRAFDRGLIGINGNYKVVVSSQFSEKTQSSYNLSQFEGKRIHLPRRLSSRPDVAKLEVHLNTYF